jgi:hypothetical protein
MTFFFNPVWSLLSSSFLPAEMMDDEVLLAVIVFTSLG